MDYTKYILSIIILLVIGFIYDKYKHLFDEPIRKDLWKIFDDPTLQDNNIVLVEDAAQSLGASYKGKKLGTFGKVGSFSFDFGKTLHTGEGGIIITDNKDLYNQAAEFSDHGHMHEPNLARGLDPRRMKGLNLRMSELTAAIGIAQLDKIDFMICDITIKTYIFTWSIIIMFKIFI